MHQWQQATTRMTIPMEKTQPLFIVIATRQRPWRTLVVLPDCRYELRQSHPVDVNPCQGQRAEDAHCLAISDLEWLWEWCQGMSHMHWSQGSLVLSPPADMYTNHIYASRDRHFRQIESLQLIFHSSIQFKKHLPIFSLQRALCKDVKTVS